MEFLVFQHVPNEHPGYYGQVARKEGVNLTVVRFWEPNYQIPSLDYFDALMIFGGPMGIGDGPDKFPSKGRERRQIEAALSKGMPILGHCLGSQQIADALGVDVHPNIINGQKAKEVGFMRIDLTELGRKHPIFDGFETPLEVLQWHGDVFELPKGAMHLAFSSVAPFQAFAQGKAIGLLPHFEFTPDMVRQQIEDDQAWIHDGIEVDEGQLIKNAYTKQSLMQKHCTLLFQNFLKIIRAHQAA